MEYFKTYLMVQIFPRLKTLDNMLILAMTCFSQTNSWIICSPEIVRGVYTRNLDSDPAYTLYSRFILANSVVQSSSLF